MANLRSMFQVHNLFSAEAASCLPSAFLQSCMQLLCMHMCWMAALSLRCILQNLPIHTCQVGQDKTRRLHCFKSAKPCIALCVLGCDPGIGMVWTTVQNAAAPARWPWWCRHLDVRCVCSLSTSLSQTWPSKTIGLPGHSRQQCNTGGFASCRSMSCVQHIPRGAAQAC